METIMNNDTNVHPVEGLFSNGLRENLFFLFVTFFSFFTRTVSYFVSKRATFLLQKTIESTYCILSIAHRGLKAEDILPF